MVRSIKRNIDDFNQNRYNLLIQYLEGSCKNKKAFHLKSYSKFYCVKHESVIYTEIYLYNGCRISMINGPGADTKLEIVPKYRGNPQSVLNELEHILYQAK